MSSSTTDSEKNTSSDEDLREDYSIDSMSFYSTIYDYRQFTSNVYMNDTHKASLSSY